VLVYLQQKVFWIKETVFCTKETSKVIFLKNVCSGGEGRRKEYCFRQSAMDIER